MGRAVAQHCADRGDTVVINGRDKARTEAVAAEIGAAMRGLAVDLSEPDTIVAGFVDV